MIPVLRMNAKYHYKNDLACSQLYDFSTKIEAYTNIEIQSISKTACKCNLLFPRILTKEVRESTLLTCQTNVCDVLSI